MEILKEGFRVQLKSLGVGDAESLAENAVDYEVAHNVAGPGLSPFPYSRDDMLSFIDSSQKRFAEKSEFHFGIFVDGRAVGACGLMNVDPVNLRAEIGYWLGRKYWGKGYGHEAVELLLGFAFKSLRLNRVYAYTKSSNERSARLLDSCGFSREGVLRESALFESGFVDELLYGILSKGYDRNKNVSVVGYK